MSLNDPVIWTVAVGLQFVFAFFLVLATFEVVLKTKNK